MSRCPIKLRILSPGSFPRKGTCQELQSQGHSLGFQMRSSPRAGFGILWAVFGPDASPLATLLLLLFLIGGAITVPLCMAFIWRILKLFTSTPFCHSPFSNDHSFAFQTIKTKFLVRQTNSLQPSKGHSLGRETPAHSPGMTLTQICPLHTNAGPILSQSLGSQALLFKREFDLILFFCLFFLSIIALQC